MTLRKFHVETHNHGWIEGYATSHDDAMQALNRIHGVTYNPEDIIMEAEKKEPMVLPPPPKPELTKRDAITFRSDMVVQLVDSMGDDQSIINAARVSTGSLGSEKANVGLLNMLMRDRHGTPFEQVVFNFYIQVPIFVARQFFRHRMASYNEESGRYKELAGEFYLPDEDRMLRQEGKPAAYTYVAGEEGDWQSVRTKLIGNSTVAYQSYCEMLDAGIAREVARMVLPLNTYTSFYVTLNARSAMNFLSLRMQNEDSTFASNPQAEIHDVANLMWAHMNSKIPQTMENFARHGYVAP